MLVVFDLDDTLYHERDFVSSGRRAIAAVMAHEPAFDIDGPWSSEMLTLYRNHMPDISLTDDASRALAFLHDRGVKMAVITDGRSVTQRHKFHALGLDRYIDPADLLISEEVGSDKTSGAAHRALMARYPGEAHYIYVGDNPAKDFIAPNRLGWHTIMLADSEHVNVHPQTLPADTAYHPHEVVTSLTILAKALEDD